MRRPRRVALVTFVLLALPATAGAKTDVFELDVTHDATGSDHAVVVTVTSPDQTGPQTINVFLRSDLDADLRPQAGRSGIQVHLEPIDPQTSSAVIALPSAGEWVVLPFADLGASGFSPLKSSDEYPIVSFTIPWAGTTTRIRASSASSPWPLVAVLVGGAVVAGLLVLGLFRRLDHRRSDSAVVVGTDESA